MFQIQVVRVLMHPNLFLQKIMISILQSQYIVVFKRYDYLPLPIMFDATPDNAAPPSPAPKNFILFPSHFALDARSISLANLLAASVPQKHSTRSMSFFNSFVKNDELK